MPSDNNPRLSASSSSRQSSQACIQFKISEVHKATKKFDDSLVIGRGYYGTIYKGEVFIGSSVVLAAIKRVNPEFKKRIIQAWPEIERLASLRHPNVVSLFGHCHYVKDVSIWRLRKQIVSGSEEEMVFVNEYIPNGTLYDHLHVHRTPFSSLQRLNICVGFACGLHYLHANGVMHGDIKSANILLTEGWEAKISDYGLLTSGEIDRPQNSLMSWIPYACGYWDPYSIANGMLTRMSDVFSFGVVVLEVFCRKLAVVESRPCDDTHRSLVFWFQDSVKIMKLEDIIDSDMRNEIIPPEFLEELFGIVERCFHNPEDRPDMTEVSSCLVKLQERFNEHLVDTGENKSAQGDPSPGPIVKEFTFRDMEEITEGFSSDVLLSQQSFGNVYLGYVVESIISTLLPSFKGNGFAVAVKRTTSEVRQSLDEWLDDVKFLGQLDHPNIIRLVGCCYRDGPEPERLLVYDYMEKSLSDIIHGDKPISYVTRVHIMMGVARALIYLYTSKGILCHFGCGDILLDENFRPKIGGFEWTKIRERHERTRIIFGYLKPEADYDINTSLKNDICSFGLVMLETITGRHPIDMEDVLVDLKSLDLAAPKSKSNRRKLKKMIDPHLKNTYSPEGAFRCMVLAKRCIAIQREQRPSRREILWRMEQIIALGN